MMGNKVADFHKQITLLNFNKFQFNEINNALNRFLTNAFVKKLLSLLKSLDENTAIRQLHQMHIFMLFVIICFINTLNVFSVSIWHLVLRRYTIVQLVRSPQHLAMLRNFQLFQLFQLFLYWKGAWKYSKNYWEAQVLEIDVSRFMVFLSFVCFYSWRYFILSSYKKCKI